MNTFAEFSESARAITETVQSWAAFIEAGRRKPPPFWAHDPARGHRPRRIGNQPTRQGRK